MIYLRHSWLHAVLLIILDLSTSAHGMTEFNTFEELFMLNEKTYATQGFGLYRHKAPRFEDLKSAYNQGKFQTHQEFLSFLDEEFPTLVQNSIFVVGSQSLQFSSLEKPRRLFYGGGMVFSINKISPNDERVEMMETSPEKGFEFKEIVFSPQGVEFVEKPKACIACHGQTSQPIWDPYDFWPTALNSFSDNFTSKSEEQILNKIPNRENLNPFAMNGFTTYLYQLVMEKWALSNKPDQLKNSGAFYVALGSLALCDKKPNFISSFVPERLQPTISEQIDQRKAYAENALNSFQSTLNQTYEKVFHDSTNRRIFPEKEVQKVDYYAHLGWALEQAELNISDFVLSHSGNEEIVFTPSNFGPDLFNQLYLHRPDLLEGLNIKKYFLFPDDDHFWFFPDCEELAAKSQQALQNFQVKSMSLTSLDTISQNRSAIGRCIKCHSLSDEFYSPDFGLAPYIPFDNPKELSKKLKTTPLKSLIEDRILRRDDKQMPPEHPLSDRETEAVLDFIERMVQ